MKYKYFQDSEVGGLNEDFVAKLDKARGLAQVPFRITSGLRDAEKNESLAGAVQDSSHLSGRAVDLRTATSGERFKIVKALLDVGFTRIGVYDKHCHVDNDSTKVQQVLWVGTSH